MKSFKIFMLFLAIFYITSIFGNSESAEKAETLCNCVKNAKKANNAIDKKNCIQLKEKHIQELGKNSPEYTSYASLISSCEKEK